MSELISNPITGENTVMVTTTMAGNEIAERRRKMLVDTMSPFGIPVFFQQGVVGSYYMDVQYRVMKHRMEAFGKMGGFEYGIICDDDFHCHSRFLEELNRTVALLPADWRCLHLCPGCLWGRSVFRGEGKWELFHEGELNPEGRLEGLAVDDSGRFFMFCGSGYWNSKRLWLGGPIAILVRRETVGDLLEEYTRLYERENNPNDVILTNILSHRDYVCRVPQLGYEDELGGSCFT
jgi:hypothetical protein